MTNPSTDASDKPLFTNPQTRRDKPTDRRTVDPGSEPILFASPVPATITDPASGQKYALRKRTQPRKPQPRLRDEDMPLRPGDVLAAGLDNGRCPVGKVSAVNDFYIRLNVYSWSACTFTAGTAVIRHDQVREFSHLAEQVDGVHVMDPLAEFQTAWTEANQ
ncbi:hypothetical protein QQG74_09225 [Micromonospora sp. FIMYZ51]|uniref:hypothetical protein n=1 Tax=Micromonospora sp. FIMYZ51 TaxID=3051832 RepID=UPI00311E8289